MSIQSENVKNIRAPMQVEIDLAARALDSSGANILLAPAVTGAAALDSNIKDAINSPEWGMRGVADLCGGFPADGSRELLDTTEAASADNQKLGIQSDVGGSMTIAVTAAVEVAAVDVAAVDAVEAVLAGASPFWNLSSLEPCVSVRVSPLSLPVTFSPSMVKVASVALLGSQDPLTLSPKRSNV